jgi:membrane associated rhomboid family serine protease
VSPTRSVTDTLDTLLFATLGLIGVNGLAFAAFPDMGSVHSVDEMESAMAMFPFMLHFDQIAPWQWVTSNFLHASIGHLLGNMVFLWAFGLVVEGKLGWWRFLTVYLLMGTAYGALVQFVMYLLSDGEGVALGASDAILRLIGLAVVWAPKNELNCFVWLMGPRTFEISILAFGSVYLAS